MWKHSLISYFWSIIQPIPSSLFPLSRFRTWSFLAWIYCRVLLFVFLIPVFSFCDHFCTTQLGNFFFLEIIIQQCHPTSSFPRPENFLFNFLLKCKLCLGFLRLHYLPLLPVQSVFQHPPSALPAYLNHGLLKQPCSSNNCFANVLCWLWSVFAPWLRGVSWDCLLVFYLDHELLQGRPGSYASHSRAPRSSE